VVTIFVDPHYGASFISLFWDIKFLRWLLDVWANVCISGLGETQTSRKERSEVRCLLNIGGGRYSWSCTVGYKQRKQESAVDGRERSIVLVTFVPQILARVLSSCQ
jgi:hypothetical protein